ncbi:MAG: hypothetical protein HQK55_14515, partial [Deltaproteobacteria bacterium]|nr:hypothetical protein [Deltaproteobacteria bacterium]
GVAAPGYIDASNKVYDENLWTLNPALIQDVGPVSLHMEGIYQFSSRKMDKTLNPGVPDYKTEGWGAYVDGLYNYGPGDAVFMFAYQQGANYARNRNTDGVMRGQLQSINSGACEHAPFLVFYDRLLFTTFGAYDSAFGKWGTQTGSYGQNWSTAHWTLGLTVDHNLTENLILRTGLGYFELTSAPTKAQLASAGVTTKGGYAITSNPSKDLGWEFDLGAVFKINENMHFTSMGGYFVAGNAWKWGADGYDVGNAWVWKNQLRFNF